MKDINMSEKSQKKKFKFKVSIKYWIMILCLSSVVISTVAVGMIVMPRLTNVLRAQVQSHQDDFVVAGTKIMQNVVLEVEERITNIENTANRLLLQGDTSIEPEMGTEPGTENPEGMTGADPTDKKNLENSDVYSILSEQLTRYTNFKGANEVILITDEYGEVVASNNTTYVGESLEAELSDKIFNGDGALSVETMVYEEKGRATLIFTKPIYHGDVLQGAILYYTNTEFLYNAITELSLTGIAAPLVYIIDQNGVTIAHTTKDSIGVETGNESLNPILEEIKAGNPPASGAHYKEVPYGTTDTVSITYGYIEGVDWLFIVAALKSQIYSDVSNITNTFIWYSVAVVAILLVIIFFVSHSFSKPIEYMEDIIKRVANLDFTIDLKDKRGAALLRRTDEIGDMAKSITFMVDSVKEKLDGMNEYSDRVNQAAIELQTITNEISEKAGDTSAITEQLSAGMQETNASTEMITGDVENLKENVMNMKTQIDGNTVRTVEIMERAKALMKKGEESQKATRDTFGEIKEKGSVAMEQSKAVNKINELTNAIMSIADQTSLLALNASIEAARAGESGKGFAVVAGEIGSLAQQSAATVSQITEIVQNVNEAVKNITDCLNMSQDFVENNVYADYEGLMRILELYNNDAASIYKAMNEIDENTTRLADTTINITSSIHSINQTIQEATVGVSDIAGRNSSIGELTAKSFEMVNDTTKIAAELKKTAQSFKL
ncbi:MAG: HAMP domain-containing protein [Lachnospiraceae bacterium]|nr:HAMP domain-containing protein [Lachnospiraceae bacterium]